MTLEHVLKIFINKKIEAGTFVPASFPREIGFVLWTKKYDLNEF